MTTAARSKKDQPPPLDPALQSRLVAKFGSRIMQEGFTALPYLVQKYFRKVPGNALYATDHLRIGKVWYSLEETKRLVCEESHMTLTEYTVMTTIWSYWWDHQNDPWPSVEKLVETLDKSERQIRRILQSLRNKGFMLCVEQYNAEGKQVSNRYDFSPFLRRLLAYLEVLDAAGAPSSFPREAAKNDRVRVSDSAPTGCQIWQGNQIESDSDESEERDSDSSGSAAGTTKGTVFPPSPACSHIAHGTIRSVEEETEETVQSNVIESHRISNRTPTEKELPGAARVKGVEENDTGKKVSKWEEFVLASGVSLAELEDMEAWLKACPRPERIPTLVQGEIDRVSQRFHNAHLMPSNRTQATKVYLYMRARGFEQEELDDLYRELVPLAERHVPPHVTNKMAWFFRALKFEALKGVLIRQEDVAAVSASESPTSADLSQVAEKRGAGGSDPLEEERGAADSQGAESEVSHVQLCRRPARTREQKEARERYAKQVRSQLRQQGVIGSVEMMIDREHSCGCPLFHGDWKCVRCCPDGRWEQSVLVLIDTILEH